MKVLNTNRYIKIFTYSFSNTLCVLLLLSLPFLTTAQENESGVFIDQERGKQDWRVETNISGNQIESIITNWGTIGNGNASINQAGVWPRGTGHGHLHEMSGIVGSQVQNINGDVIPMVSDGYGAATVEAQEQEADPNTNVFFKFQPIPGYFNPNIDNPEIANSLNPESWPNEWPDKPASFDGNWNGFFGLNQFNADQEVYYVVDDLSNKEFEYFPDASDSTRRGLGLQIRVRLFQWSQALAKDILFMQYEVSNIADATYTRDLQRNPIIFGGYTDINASGAGATDDAAAFDDDVDIVFGWSQTGVGTWSQFRDIPPGYIGWKFLESPGIDDDNIDNDNDGLVDESRDNDAGEFIFGPVGIFDDPKEHWSGDEDGDWNPNFDDVGSDGIGPEQDGYPGPDPDGTEGNGKPDQGEPNFGRLDNDESDQVGLTSFFAPAFGTINIQNENTVWPNLRPGFFDVPQQGINQIFVFGSGPFDLPPNVTERFSTCFVFGADESAMFRSAQVAQRIFDSDYRFARPPRQPELEAIPGDEKVTLKWDAVVEQSRDPVYGQDFEGYRIIKATDPQFNDAVDITDNQGNPVYKQSIAQFDLLNGLKGPHPLQFGESIDLPNGVHFFMGDDTGLQHSFVDEDVINGRTYYYALLAYDKGYIPEFFDRGLSDLENLFPIPPSESPATITVNQGVVTKFDKNAVRVRPNTQPSDVKIGSLETDSQNRLPRTEGVATGTVKAIPIDPEALIDDQLEISFQQEELETSVEFRPISFTVTNSEGIDIVKEEPIPKNLDDEFADSWKFELIKEGFTLEFENENPDQNLTKGNSSWNFDRENNLKTDVSLTNSGALWPINVVIEFTGELGADTSFVTRFGQNSFPVDFKVYEKGTQKPIDFVLVELDSTRDRDPVEDYDGNSIDPGDVIQLVFKDTPSSFSFTQSWQVSFKNAVDENGEVLPSDQVIKPAPPDTFFIRSPVPFGERDTYTLRTNSGSKINDADSEILDEIKVVPNPYVAATIIEERPFLQGRGERRIEFRNLPANAQLKIFTTSGNMVRELEGDNGVAVWDLQTHEGLEVAYGMYFYYVKAEGIGEKTGKFAIIK